MIKNLISKIREKCYSLYVGLFANILIGVLAGIILYAIVQLASDFYVRESYASPSRKLEREAETAVSLQDYISDRGILRSDFDAIGEWDRKNRYVYIMLFDGERIVYTTDLGAVDPDNAPPSSNEGYSGSGITVDYPSFATLRRYAAQGERAALYFSDGALSVSVAEISEYFYYDIINIIAIALALVVLGVTVIGYFRRMINRIRRLEADVTIVTHSNMEHRISARGFDEISRLSSNVENMRHYILDNLRREREARESNTELITAMSHDIRTPLTVMLGYLEMMKSEAEDMPILSEYIEALEKTALRLKTLSDDMFKYSLAFGDATEGINLEEYDARMLFEQMLSEHVVLLKESGYDVTVDDLTDSMPEGATVLTDAQNLMRIVDNVFSNIYKYADIAKPIRITLSAISGRRIQFECVNVIRTDTYKAESNGIGLKTCRRLAGIIAESFEYGSSEGSFRCALTMKTEAPAASEATEQTGSDSGAGRRTVLAFIRDTAALARTKILAVFERVTRKNKGEEPVDGAKTVENGQKEEAISSEAHEIPDDTPIYETEEAVLEENREESGKAATGLGDQEAETEDEGVDTAEENGGRAVEETDKEQTHTEIPDADTEDDSQEPIAESESEAAVAVPGDTDAENTAESESEQEQEKSDAAESDALGDERREPTKDTKNTAETKPAETKPAETKPAETKPAETKPAETKTAETKLAETKPAEVRAAEAKVSEVKPIEIKAEAKLTETRSTHEHRAVNIAKAIEPARNEPARVADTAREHRNEPARSVNIAKAIEQAPRADTSDNDTAQEELGVDKND